MTLLGQDEVCSHTCTAAVATVHIKPEHQLAEH